MKTNDYLDQLQAVVDDYYAAMDAAGNEQLPKSATSAQLRKWAGEYRAQHPFPITDGQKTVLDAYKMSLRRDTELLSFDAITFDLDDMVATVATAGFPGFLITNSAVGLRTALLLEKAGARLEGIRKNYVANLGSYESGFWFTV